MTKARDLAGFSTGSITNTTADGLILKGDGSSTDVVIKNGANATVATVSDGSTNLSVAGSVTGALARGAIQVGNSSGVAAALAKGTSGYVLTAGANDLSWAEGGGGGTEFIASSGAISNAATVAFTQFDSSKYDAYQFYYYYVIPSGDNVYFVWNSSTDGGSSYAESNGDYKYGSDGNGTNVPYGYVESWGGVGGDTAEYGITGAVQLMYPHNTTTQKILQHLSGPSYYAYNGVLSQQTQTSGMSYTTALTDIDAIRFKFASGNIESGEIVMYGIKNS